MRWGLTVVATMAAVGVLGAAEKPTSTALVELASTYLTSFVQRFSSVVADERYIQTWMSNSGVTLARRELKSEFLLTRPNPTSPLMTFRDVVEVDGVAVRDRDDRLMELFLKPSAKATEEATIITIESSRYNVGNLARTVNQPFYALIFLQPSYNKRFNYSVDKLDKNVGQDVWIMQYKETARPSFARGASGKELPARGRYWINAVTGEILKTEILLEDSTHKTEITTTFRMNDRFKIGLPSEMKEQYALKGNAGKITATATYDRFREFQIQTLEVPK
jgi:hypothetical protein